MLEVEGLHTYYGRAHILADVGFAVAQGEVVVLLGRNGAGKSTTLRSIMGLVRPARGRVLFRGADITGRQPFEIARLGLGYAPEDRRVFVELTVEENLEVGRRLDDGRCSHVDDREIVRTVPNLARMRGRAAGQMSGGEQQMLTIARTLMGQPSVSAAGRALGGTGAGDRGADGEDDFGPEARGPDGAAVGAEPALLRAPWPTGR